MRIRLILIFGLLAFSNLNAQVQNNINDPVSYLIKKILLSDRDSGSIVIIPLDVKNIKHFDSTIEIQYWRILNNYYKNISRDSLKEMVQKSIWINKNLNINKIKIYYPVESVNISKEDLFKKYNYCPVFSISNPVYSLDKKTCIIYISGYNIGPFTVEIKMDNFGNWNSYTVTTDWLS